MFFDIRQNEESARNYTTTILKRKNEGISKMADNRVIIFDTTLRDGEQALPQSLSMRQKLQIALALEELGVDVIEAGFPVSSQGDFESVQTIAQTLKRSIPCGLSRAILKDVECAGEALKVAEHFRIHTFIATSSIHVKDKLRKSFDDVLAMGVAAVKCARQYTDDVEFSCEDAGRTPIDQLCRMVEEAIEAGATTINIPDTVGYTVPMEFGGIISQILNRVPNIDKAVLSVHCHNDLGMATANSLTAVQMGARQIECCMNGLGERAGNCSLEEVATAILIGDGRDEADEHKISEEHVRSIWNDDDLYTIHYDVDIEAARNELQGTGTASRFGENYIYAEAIITAALYSREKFKGTGTPDFFCTPHLVNVMLLARDTNGRRIYNSKADLAAALNINELHTAEQFEGLARTDKTGKKHNLLGIFVNLSDYTVGSTKGGEITRFNQFDIDFNQEKYLIETRLSGALTRLWSAIALEEPVKASSGQTEDTGHDGT